MINTNGMPSQPNHKKMSQISANLVVEMALFGTPSQAHQPAYSFKHCW